MPKNIIDQDSKLSKKFPLSVKIAIFVLIKKRLNFYSCMYWLWNLWCVNLSILTWLHFHPPHWTILIFLKQLHLFYLNSYTKSDSSHISALGFTYKSGPFNWCFSIHLQITCLMTSEDPSTWGQCYASLEIIEPVGIMRFLGRKLHCSS